MSLPRHYNPGWLDDEALVAGFIARQSDFAFLRDELARAPRVGSVQHYLLVGLRGAGKTTLLKRLAVAIRQEQALGDHLIALSFPEELYQVKHLADFWWAACEALAEELERIGHKAGAARLFDEIDRARLSGRAADPLSEEGLTRLLALCAEIERRPVLLVDNLDLLFRRIDKQGRKLKDPLSPAYWALREALSTTTSPIVVGGSVRLSEPFTDYDKAFYDFFISRRLGRLPLEEVRRVLEHLADRSGLPEVKERLHARPARIQTLTELTGGNPRAIGLIFELLRQGPNRRAVEDFEGLMDLTTPYYKARFEDLSEQAQVVMHALAVRRPGEGGGLRFGHTAAEIGTHAGLPTNTVSAQLDVLEREGLVEKSAAHGRTQYRIAEQLFRLWLQLRATRRIRQGVIGLAEFLEALFDPEELTGQLRGGGGDLAGARLAFAVADTRGAEPMRRGLTAYGAYCLLNHTASHGDELNQLLPAGDLPEDLHALVQLRRQLQRCGGGGLSGEEQAALLGSLQLRPAEKHASVEALCTPESAPGECARLRPRLAKERTDLLRQGLLEGDLPLLYRLRAEGQLPLPGLTPHDAEVACATNPEPALRALIWRLVGARLCMKFADETVARAWLAWGRKHAAEAPSVAWANVAGALRLSQQFGPASEALEQAFARGESSRAWHDRGGLLHATQGDPNQAEAAYRKAIELDPNDARPWCGLGYLLADKLHRYEEAEAAYRKAIELDPAHALPWNNLGYLLAEKLHRYEEAEAAYRKAFELDPAYARSWNNLGYLLADKLHRYESAEAAYRKAIELNPAYAWPWNNLGNLLANHLHRYEEAEAAYRKAIDLDPAYARPWNDLGVLLADELHHYEEAKAAYLKAIELDPSYASTWNNLGYLLAHKFHCNEDAEAAFRRAIELEPADAWPWNGLGNVLADQPHRYEEAEAAYRKAIELDPAYAFPWNNLGNLLADQPHRYEEAEAAYRNAIELDPAYARPWNNLGNLLADKFHRYEEAEAAYHKAIELDPAYAWPWNNLGNLLADKLHRYEEAEAAYHKAIELDPADAWPWNDLGYLLADELHRYEEAEAAYRKAIELDPADAWPWNKLGNLLADKLHRYEEAEAAYRKAIELDPGDAWPWNKLGNLLADELHRYEEAEAAYRKAIELDPSLGQPWGNLGHLLETQGRLEEAEATYSQAESLDAAQQSHWQRLRATVAERRHATAARRALTEGNLPALRESLGRLIDQSEDLAATLAGRPLFEALLAPALAERSQAVALLGALRELGLDQQARPLLLAFQAAVEQRPEALEDLEPEIRNASREVYERLMAGREGRRSPPG